MAHPDRAQTPFTVQCTLYSQFFVNQGNAPHLALWVRTVQGDYMVTPRSHILAEDEVKPKPSELWAGSDWELREGAASGSLQGGKLFHVLSAPLPFSNQLSDSCLHFSNCALGLSGFSELTIMPSLLKWLLSITQCKTWFYKPACRNGLLYSLRAFINYVQKYSKVGANSLDWFWLHKRQVISNYEN